MHLKHVVNRLTLVAFAVFGTVSTAWAGTPGILGYGPLAAPVSTPMLAGWSLLLMALLLSVVAYRVLRSRVNGRQLGHLALVGSLIAGGAASDDLIQSATAVAVIPMTVAMNVSTGGTANIAYGISQATNTSGVPLQITSLTVTSNSYFFTNPGVIYTPQCVVGTVVSPGGSCYVDLTSGT